ncbi:asparagine synthase-related protein [Propionimicrobium lymphophilum]|uniref:asparagine synthase-related protein n=1 Tax=Propionimicrobium lymphophilum TaxID=33012 RepID=UPI003EC8A654
MSGHRLILTSPKWSTGETEGLHVWHSVKQEVPAGLSPGFDTKDLGKLTGNWAVVDQREDEIVIATDLVRSHPLAYSYQDGSWIVTDDIEHLRELMPFEPNKTQIDIFENTVFTLGDETLVNGVYSSPAASLIRLKPDGSKFYEDLVDYRFSETPIDAPDAFARKFSYALDTAFKRLLEISGNRELVIPLSGGLDSRLVALWLKKLGAPNVTCFTYGKPGSAESKISKQVADDLGLDWHYVEMDVDEVRRAWHSPEADEFLRATWKGTSLPHIQDWFALRQLKANATISADSIFLPGHTIVGNMHDEELANITPSDEQLETALLKHHANAQGKWRQTAKIPAIRETVETAVRAFSGLDRHAQETFEWFNINERQAKYINNSMASYEHFGYSWALPMLEEDLVNVWLSGSPELTLTRDWYGDFVAKEFAAATGRSIKLFEPPSTKMPGFVKHLLLAGMRATKVDILLERRRSAQTVLHHPMSFEALTDVPPIEQRIKIMRGANQLSFWVTAFLNNSWGGQGDIVPAHT